MSASATKCVEELDTKKVSIRGESETRNQWEIEDIFLYLQSVLRFSSYVLDPMVSALKIYLLVFKNTRCVHYNGEMQ